MVLFLLLYISIYGGVHAYAFMKLKRGLELGMTGNSLLALLMLLMVVAPMAVRAMEHAVQGTLARGLAVIAFTWMGLVFLFVSCSFLFDIYRFLHFLTRHLLNSPLAHLTFSHRTYCLVALLLTAVIAVYGYFEARAIRTEVITLTTDKLPPDVKEIRIVQISDIHLGLIVGKSRLQRIINKVKDARPDILVSTGDLVDGYMDRPEALAGMLKSVPAKYGKFAVTGNHEFYAGLERALAFTEKAGFVVLREDGRTVDGVINIAGVDDPARGRYRKKHALSEKALLEKLPRDRFTLLLKHQPVVSPQSVKLFDLQLSGHTHKGQIFPFSLATRMFYRMHTGLSTLGNGAHLYVSRGTGTWGPPIRFLAPPEVTVIDLFRPSKRPS
ncbi:MAG: metallophosphoesterase [Deltaproteobacteria bacterium]|nr:metallophosphoesterase [Deltaproteobacteria bacterium]